jgi:hypothetical protein
LIDEDILALTNVGFSNITWRNSITKRYAVMSIDRAVLAFAGAMVLTGLVLGHYVNGYWNWLSAFVGANLLQAAFTGFCPLAKLLKAAGMKPGAAF